MSYTQREPTCRCTSPGSLGVLETKAATKATGIRSDSDLYTYSFPWPPWKGQYIAFGPEILLYLKDTAREQQVDARIELNRQVNSMNWSTASQAWTLDVTDITTSDATHNYIGARTERIRCRFVLNRHWLSRPLHAQFWPKYLNVQVKSVVVVGSGATAITLVPTLARRGAAHVTKLQRSPTCITSAPRGSLVQASSKLALRRLTPDLDSYQLLRHGNTRPELRLDIIVTATGLELRFGGSIRISVDGRPFTL
ncbi:hypothetical protein MY11210_008501, partial [Beauveria gryllotalpidicola]